MGQNSSRTTHQAPPTTSAAPQAPHATSTPSSSSLPGPAPTTSSHPTRRSTVRRSLLKLMKPNTSPSPTNITPNQVTPVSTTTSRNKRWSTFRRNSKTPIVDIPPSDPGIVAGEKDKGKGRASDEDPGENIQAETLGSLGSASSLSHAGSFSPASSSSSTSTSPSINNTPPPRRDQAKFSTENLPDTADTCFAEDGDKDQEGGSNPDEVVISPETTFAGVAENSSETTETGASSCNHSQAEDPQTGQDPQFASYIPSSQHLPPPPVPPIPQLPTPARQFPPPGTLVVVQGVVHTTDVTPARQSPSSSRTTSTTNSPPSTTNTGANVDSNASPSGVARANSLGSGTRSRLTSLLPRARPASMLPSTSSLPRYSSRNGELSGDEADNEGSDVSDAAAPEDSGPHDEGRSNGPNTGPISSSSIDVLGTLLSVAAAATAASLLTGSSEPIFSSPLAPSNPSPNNDEPVSPSTPYSSTRPMSPTPTAGLGTLGFEIPDSQAREQSGRERMRNVWGSLRERLGLRASGPSATPMDTQNSMDAGPPEGAPNGNPRQMDAREAMLAEMARAFNLGLGIPNNASEVAPGPTSEEASREGSPEADGSAPTTRPQPAAGSFERFLIDLQLDLRRELMRPDDDPAEESDSAVPTVETDGSSEGNVDGGENSLPSESTSSLEGGVDSRTLSDSTGSSPQGSPSIGDTDASAADVNASTSGPSSGTQRRPGGGINWWRLYRFPPISAPQVQNLSAAANPSQSPQSINGLSPATDPTTSTTSGTAPVSTDIPTAASIVIPVIVVGLQSVNRAGRRPERRPEAPSGPGGGGDVFGDDDDVNLEEEVDFENFPAPPEGEDTFGPQRSRRWRSRAADALRNLRPGRRQEREAQSSTTSAGSRTFLIYVIGGYYPPDHHIVTGANTLDSFEALWELAELLGQVKPPTTSKEELEKSGLEIIKPCSLEAFERDGKISSNCIERCLICLDDYDAKDERRVMNCRHAFHKICVDKWMLTGRNNCPACRSKGVSTPEPVES